MPENATITTDNPLTSEEQEVLHLVLDQIIPADPERNKPSAADVEILHYIRDEHAAYLPTLKGELETLATTALQLKARSFTSLTRDEQVEIVNSVRDDNPSFMSRLAICTAERYYQDDRVLNAIGMEARPPFPKGYEVERGDLTLLDPVRDRGSIYRKTPD